jgi:hypothetical protein
MLLQYASRYATTHVTHWFGTGLQFGMSHDMGTEFGGLCMDKVTYM